MGRKHMTRRTFTKMVSRLAKADGLTSAPRKAAVLHALNLWDNSTEAERVELTRMLNERLDGRPIARPPRREEEDGDNTVR